MKRILFAISLLITCISYGQVYKNDTATYGIFENRIKPKNALGVPRKAALTTNTNDTTAQIFITNLDSIIMYTKGVYINLSRNLAALKANAPLVITGGIISADTTPGNPKLTSHYQLTQATDPFYNAAAFDNTMRVLTLTRQNGLSTTLVIPSGAPTLTGITAVTNSRSGNIITQSFNNGFVAQFSVRDADSATQGTVTAVGTNTGTGLMGGTITNTGTLSNDTTLLSTRANRQKGIDSINVLLALKLNTADTIPQMAQYHYKANQTRILGEPTVYNAFPQACTLNDTAWVIFSGNGTNHTGKFDIVAQYSVDGNNWTRQTLLTNASFSYPNHGGGVNDIGELLVFAEVTTGSGLNWTAYNTMNCYKKVGGSLVLISANLPLNGCTDAAPFGKLVVLPSGALLQTIYGDAGATQKCYTIISTDHGVTWTVKSNIITSTQFYTEVCMTKVSGTTDANTTLLAAIRNASAMEMFISKNGGTTWTSCGLIEPTQSIQAVAPWLDVYRGNVMLMYGDRTYGVMRTIQYDSLYIDSANVFTAIPTNAVVNKAVLYSSLLNTKANGDQTSGSFGYGAFFCLKKILFYTCYDIDQNQRPPYGTGLARLQTNIITNRFYREIQTGEAFSQVVIPVDSLTGVQDEVTVNGVYNTPKSGSLVIGTPQPIAFNSGPTFARLQLQSQVGAITVTNRSHLTTDNILNKFANGLDSLFIGVEASGGGSTFVNTIAGAGIVGTVAAFPLQFAAGNSVRTTILPNGNFGHGNTAPSSFFNVGGNNELSVDVTGNLSAPTLTATAQVKGGTLTVAGGADVGTLTSTTNAYVGGLLTVGGKIRQTQTGSDGNESLNSDGRFTTVTLNHLGVVSAQWFYDATNNRVSFQNTVAGGTVRFIPGSGAAGSWDLLNNGALVQASVGIPANGNEKFHALGTGVIRDTLIVSAVMLPSGGSPAMTFATDGSIQPLATGGTQSFTGTLNITTTAAGANLAISGTTALSAVFATSIIVSGDITATGNVNATGINATGSVTSAAITYTTGDYDVLVRNRTTGRYERSPNGFINNGTSAQLNANFNLQGNSTGSIAEVANITATGGSTFTALNLATDVGTALTTGSVILGSYGELDYTTTASRTIGSSNVTGAGLFLNKPVISGSSTITMTQSAGGGIRAMSGLTGMFYEPSTAATSSTITHAAGLRSFLFADNTSNLYTITNYYGVLVGSTTEFAPTNITNRYGIYQEGTSDQNILKGATTFGSTITTAAPASSTAQPWKLGALTTTLGVVSTNAIYVEVNGVSYKLAIVN